MIIGTTNITTLLIMIGILYINTKYFSPKNLNFQLIINDLIITCEPEDESKITQLIYNAHEEAERLINRLGIELDESPINIII